MSLACIIDEFLHACVQLEVLRFPSLRLLFPSDPQTRMVESRPGIAFVEYENEMQSGVAMQGLQGFKVTPQNAMQISYAKQ